MKICFVLPQMLKKPIGGYKMVYEYANRLSIEGHKVAILFLNENALERFHFPKVIRNIMIRIFTYREPKWFLLHKDIDKISSTSYRKLKMLNSYNLIIATGVDTVEKTIRLFPDKQKAYFIQDYEEWVYPRKLINKTFGMGLDNIVISSWLKEIVDNYGKKPSLLIRNPLDVSIYKLKTPIKKRSKYSLGVLYHEASHKGFKYAYAAIIKLKTIFPELNVQMFGTSIPRFEIPSWIDFKLNASQEETVEIYNSVSIFLCATIREGFGLTGLEAMSCGAALVSSEYKGVKEYAIDNVNAKLCSVGSVESLVEGVKDLIEDDEKRVGIALNGIRSAKEYSWEVAMKIFNAYLHRCQKNFDKRYNSED